MKSIFLFIIVAAFRFTTHAQQTPIHGDFALKNVHTGKYVRIKDANGANGTPIVAYSPEDWKCMTWEFQPSANGCYTLKNLLSGKTFQPLNGETKPGATLEELFTNTFCFIASANWPSFSCGAPLLPNIGVSNGPGNGH